MNEEQVSNKQIKPSSEDISHYVAFCFRSDILKQLKKSKHPHVLATQLYEKETGIHIPLAVSRSNLKRWMLVGNVLKPRK